jgi:predicted dehydrogenase
MYVGGRGAGTDGTVLPTLMQAQTQGLIGEILVAATTERSIYALQQKLGELNGRMGTQVQVRGYPAGAERDPLAYRQALAELTHPGCAIVAVPDHLHASITSDVIRARVHPLVVKPLTPTLGEAQGLVELADKHNVYGAVEFHKRWDETNLLLRQALSDSRLGNVRYVAVEYSQRRMMRNVFESWLDHTNIFQYLGVHYVDLIYFLTGARPVRALATGQPGFGGNHSPPGHDAIQALIEWEDPPTKRRFVSNIVTNWIDPDCTSAMSDQKITVVGTRGRYQIDQKHRGAQLVTQQGGVEDINPYFSQIYAGADGNIGVHGYGPRSIMQFLTDVRDLAAGRRKRQDLVWSRPSFQDCLTSTAVTEAVNRSLSQGNGWVAVEEANLTAQSGPTGRDLRT